MSPARTDRTLGSNFTAYFHDTDNVPFVHGPIDRPTYCYDGTYVCADTFFCIKWEENKILEVQEDALDDPPPKEAIGKVSYNRVNRLLRPYRIHEEDMLAGMEPHILGTREEYEDLNEPVRFAYDPASRRKHRIYPPYPDTIDAERRLRLQCPSLRHTTNARTNPFRPSQEPYRHHLIGNQVNWVPDPHIWNLNPRSVRLPPPNPEVKDERDVWVQSASSMYVEKNNRIELRVQCGAEIGKDMRDPRSWCKRTWFLTDEEYFAPERSGPHLCWSHMFDERMQSAIKTAPFDLSVEPTWHPQENPLHGVQKYYPPDHLNVENVFLDRKDFQRTKTLEGWGKLTDLQRDATFRFYGIPKRPYMLLEPCELRRLQWCQADINAYYYLLEQAWVGLPAEVKAFRAYHLRKGHDRPWKPAIKGQDLERLKTALGLPIYDPLNP